MSDPPVNPPPRRRIRPAAAPAVAGLAASAPDPTDTAYEGPTNFAGMTVRQRVDAMRALDPAAATQFLLDTAFQFMLAGTPVDVMAQRMGYGVGRVLQIRAQVRERIRNEMHDLDVRSYVGEMLGQFKEAAAMGFREASAAGAKEYGRRLKGVETAMKALNDQSRLLHLAGAFEGAPLRPALKPPGEDDQTNGVNVLKDLARSFLSGGYSRDPGAAPIPGTIIDAEPR